MRGKLAKGKVEKSYVGKSTGLINTFHFALFPRYVLQINRKILLPERVKSDAAAAPADVCAYIRNFSHMYLYRILERIIFLKELL